MHITRRITLWLTCSTWSLLIAGLGCGDQPPAPQTATGAPRQSKQTAPVRRTGYVGAAACAECHADIAEQYAGHSMGRSLATVEQLLDDESAGAIQDGAPRAFEAGGFRYELIERDGKLLHRQSRLAADGGEMAVIEEEVSYAVGSGNHGQSYIIDRDGYLFMSPVTWYPDKQIWDLSPGFETVNSQFNRPIIEACLFCHSNRATHVPHTANRYSQPVFDGHSIGCERCHGPGERHVKLHREGADLDDDGEQWIVNPARLDPALREAVCQQCHLSGAARVLKPGKSLYDFRPGEPLDDCFSVFLLRPDLNPHERLVGQVEQMYESRCFQESNGKLGCISCHDPHGLPTAEERIDFYRERCLQCHETDDCGVEETVRRDADPLDSCMDCHMPRHDTEIRHASVVDHRLRRRPDGAESTDEDAKSSDVRALPLVRFADPDADETGIDREMAIAMLMARARHPEVLPAEALPRVIAALEQAARYDADDLDAYESLGAAYLAANRPGDALRALFHVLRQQPKRESSLAVAGELLMARRDYPQAIETWRSAVGANPWMARYWYALAQAQAGARRWEACFETVQDATQRFPTSIGARQLLIESALRLGRRQVAQETFEWLKRYKPQGMDALSQWYQQHPLRQ